jgi:hypothetical protein
MVTSTVDTPFDVPGSGSSDAEIFARVIAPDRCDLTEEVAKTFLSYSFSSEDRARMSELADKARQGTLSPQEERLIDSYIRVGNLFSLLKVKARLSLEQRKRA